jgi:hypothetical protein
MLEIVSIASKAEAKKSLPSVGIHAGNTEHLERLNLNDKKHEADVSSNLATWLRPVCRLLQMRDLTRTAVAIQSRTEKIKDSISIDMKLGLTPLYGPVEEPVNSVEPVNLRILELREQIAAIPVEPRDVMSLADIRAHILANSVAEA